MSITIILIQSANFLKERCNMALFLSDVNFYRALTKASTRSKLTNEDFGTYFLMLSLITKFKKNTS